MINIVMCPGGNEYYMSTGDAMGGIITTLVVTIGICTGSFLMYYYLSKRNLEIKAFMYFIGLVIALAILNIWQFLQFL